MEYDQQNKQDGHGDRPDYKNYYPYQHYYDSEGRPKKKKHTGLLVVLVILALLSGAASWAVNVLGMRVDVGQNGIRLSIGEPFSEEETKEAQVQTVEPPEPPAEPQPAVQPAAEPEVKPQPKPQKKETVDSGMNLKDSPASVENRPSEDDKALSLQQIYQKVIPSVASISCIHTNGTSSGTGIVMSREGYIITNFHVIDGAKQIYVLLNDDVQYPATLIGGDETTDLAVLQVEAPNLVPAEFGDSDMLRVGDMVVAIGDPLGAELRGTMTDGIVSAINRDLNLSGRQMTLIQTNAALNSGNSGGPLINCYGQVIGINTMKMSNYSSTSATVEGLGFAIPITAAQPIIDELLTKGYVSGRPALGIQGQNLDIRAQFFYHMPSGVVVTGILPESDAAAKGLMEDDVIVGINDTTITSLEDLVRAKNNLVAGDVVKLTIYRNKQYYSADVTLMDQVSPEIY